VTDAKGSPVPASQVNAIILDSLRSTESKLPFAADHVLLAINKLGDGGYSLCLMDTRQFDIRDIHTALKISGDHPKFKVIDAIDGTVLGVGESAIPVKVPAGLFRVLRVVPIDR
jgi:hypothetical protein